MIPRAHITAWRHQAPWPDDMLVEQDLVLSRALVELYSDPFLGTELAFRGGTALNKLVFDSAARYSEDIDLVQVRAGPIRPLMQAIHGRLDPWLGPPRTRQGPAGVKMLYRFDSEMAPFGSRRLKIEINTREHYTSRGLIRREFAVQNPWFRDSAEVLTYSAEELLATKLRALYQRKKGRDLFDLAHALSGLNLDPKEIVATFLFYMDRGGTPVSRAEFEANLSGKACDRAFAEDVVPLLGPGISWDFESGLACIREQLVALLPGSPWKGASGKP